MSRSPDAAVPAERGRAAGALALLSLVWGYNWVVMKACLVYAAPLDIAGWRFLVAGLTLIPVLRWMGLPVAVPRRDWGLALLLAGFLAVNFALTFTALAFGGTGKTAVLTYTMPVWVVLLAHVFLGERMRPWQWAACAVAAAGLVVLVDPRELGGSLPSLVAVIGGFSWAVSIVVLKKIQAGTRTHLLTLTVWQMLLGSGFMFAAAFVTGTRPTQWTPGFVASLLFTSVVASTFGWILFQYALSRLSAGVTGFGTLATPVVGVLAAWLQFGETPSPMEATGMALIGAGLTLLLVPAAVRGTMQGARSTGPTRHEGQGGRRK